MKTKSKLMAAALVLVGCGIDEEQKSVPEGLVLEDVTADHVSGTLGRDGVGVVFDFSYAGADQVATIATPDGRPLLDTALVDGIETSTFLGRFTIVGAQGVEPKTDGDENAYSELHAMDEGALIRELREQLDDNGIDREMYAAPKPAKDERQSWNARILQCGERIAVPTYSWWWPVYTSWDNTSTVYWGNYRINDGAITYYGADAPRGQGYFYYNADYWSWWTVYWTNLCWYGPSPLWFDSQLL